MPYVLMVDVLMAVGVDGCMTVLMAVRVDGFTC